MAHSDTLQDPQRWRSKKPALLHCVFFILSNLLCIPGSSHSDPGHVTLVSLVAWLPQGPPGGGSGERWESREMKRVLRPLFLAGILSSAGLLLICCTNTS